MIRKVPVERRRKPSKRVNARFVCSMLERPESGETLDFGEGGLCMYLTKPLEVGSPIELRCEDIWEKSKKGVVKWCDTISPRLYRIGIEFMGNP